LICFNIATCALRSDRLIPGDDCWVPKVRPAPAAKARSGTKSATNRSSAIQKGLRAIRSTQRSAAARPGPRNGRLPTKITQAIATRLSAALCSASRLRRLKRPGDPAPAARTQAAAAWERGQTRSRTRSETEDPSLSSASARESGRGMQMGKAG
jgi:hypothetical protein